MLGKIIVVALILEVQSHIDEKFYGTVHDGRLMYTNYNPVTFRNQPQSEGRYILNWPAVKIENGGETFYGQAYKDRNGGYCAKFYIRGDLVSTCTGFRILVDYRPFNLVQPRNFNSHVDERVEYGQNVLVLIRNENSLSSFFGTLNTNELVVDYVDYDNIPHTYEVKHAKQEENLLYLVTPLH